MLVQCARCGISFDPSLRRCAACGAEHTLSGEEMLSVFERESLSQVARGRTLANLQKWLIDECGLSPSDADEVRLRVRGHLRKNARAQGRRLIVSGLFVFVCSGFFYFLTQGRVPFFSGVLFVVLGLAMSLAGILKFLTGWNLTGHDDE